MMNKNVKRALSLTTLLFVCMNLSGCVVLQMVMAKKQQDEQMAEYERQRAENAKRQAAAQEEYAYQQKVAEAQNQIFMTAMDEQVYQKSCEALRKDVEDVVTLLAYDVHYTSDEEKVITSWRYVSADYANGQQIRKSSKNRYTTELKAEGEGCKVSSLYQVSMENEPVQNARAVDFEEALLKKVEPEKYNALEQALDKVKEDMDSERAKSKEEEQQAVDSQTTES